MKQTTDYRYDDEHALVLESPVQDPMRTINSYFNNYGWEETKLNLRQMLKAALQSDEYADANERKCLIDFTEGILSVLKAGHSMAETKEPVMSVNW